MRKDPIVPQWVWTWYLINVFVLIPDWLFIMLRPRSLTGGDLAWLFRIFNVYAEIDQLFKDQSHNIVWCIYALSTIDIILLSFLFATFSSRMHKPSFALLAMCRAVFIATKTAIYLLYSIDHIAPRWLVPVNIMNGQWVFVPALIIWQVSAKLLARIDNPNMKES